MKLLDQVLLPAVLDSVGEAIITIDASSTIVMVNREAQRIWGYREDELLGQPLVMLMPEPYRAAHLAGLARYLESGVARVLGQRLELEGLRHDGTVFLLELHIQETRTDAQLFFTASVRDLTEQKRAERRLAAQHAITRILAEAPSLQAATPQLLQAICESLDWQVGQLWRRDRTANVLCYVERWHGASLDAAALAAHSQQLTLAYGQGFPGQIWARGAPLWIPDVVTDPVFLRRTAAAHDNLHTAFGFPVLLGNEVLGVMEFFSQRIREPNAELLAMLGTIGSQIGQVMERRRVEEERAALVGQLQAAVDLRDQFLSIAAHELKTPMTSLLLYLELLERRLQRASDANAAQLRAVHTIREQAERLNRLSSALLDLSRLQQGRLTIEREPVQLVDLVRSIVELQAPLWDRHHLQLHLPDAPLVVMGDALRLGQVVQNLLENAVKYSPGGGVVQVGLDRRDDYACLWVRDQGIGIPEEALPQLFGRFFRASNADPEHIAGLGIGLYLVKEIVTQHEGTVAVESHEGSGSTFTICLPRSDVVSGGGESSGADESTAGIGA